MKLSLENYFAFLITIVLDIFLSGFYFVAHIIGC